MKRFAREWLWFIGCALPSIGQQVQDARAHPKDWGIDYVEVIGTGVLIGIGLYLVVGLVRVTLWSVQTVIGYDG